MSHLLGEPDPQLLKNETLVEIFEATAQNHPHQPAVIVQDRTVMYSELVIRVDELCRQLTAQGVTRGARVAMLMPRGIEACAALLAIMKCGAAYVPIDPSYPDERCVFIVGDCQAAAVMTTRALFPRAQFGALAIVVVDFNEVAAKRTSQNLVESAALPDDIAYIIYTSGTTGKPKGVPITHRSACHFVRAEAKLFSLNCHDRIYHGFSLSFDASVEELWLAWFAGGSLVLAPDEIARSGRELAHWLSQQDITVLSCVPTLLSLFEDDIPSMKLLILGGEVCAPSLVAQWAKNGRRMVNTYGPTEATVVSTYAWCHADQPVTIGRPLPNYVASILDESLRPVADGESGELCLGGPGLASGYLNREELTRIKFIDNPQADELDAPARLYRTGDRVRLNSGGELEFLGRVDDQVKLRGYRIELGDVEAALLTLPGVRHAAVTVREDIPGLPQLVGYVTPKDPTGEPFDEALFRTILRSQLPAFMVPALIETIPAIPILVSGKIDRKALPPPVNRTANVSPSTTAEGHSDMERSVIAAWSDLFPGQSVGRTDNFFDLGGHSLLATRMISDFRRRPGLGEASVVDVYRHPVLTEFSACLETRLQASPAVQKSSKVAPVGSPVRWCCWVAQLLGLYLVFAIFSLQWFIPWFVFDYFEDVSHRLMFAGLLGLAVAFAFQPVQMVLCVAVKWIVIGRYKEGDYPLWSSYYWRFWLVNSLYRLFAFSSLHGTPFMPQLCRFMGTKVGKNVFIAADIAGSDLIDIGEGTSLSSGAQLRFFSVEDGLLKLRRIRIGANCEIGQHAIIEGGAVMEDNSTLGPLSLLKEGDVLPANEVWEGSPARRIESNDPKLPPAPSIGPWQRFVSLCCYSFGFLLLAVFPLVSSIPGGLLLGWVDNNFAWYWAAATTPLVVASFMLFLALQIALTKRLLMGEVHAGRHPLHGWFYIKHWFCDQLIRLSLDLLFPAYSTLYLAPWLRLMGAKLGRHAEVSTMMHFTPDLVDLGDDVFVADAASVGASRVSGGWIELAPVKIGNASFIGNSAVISGGTELGEKCLIGCLSTPPRSPQERARYDASWMGSPAMLLPNRLINKDFSDEFTYRPSRQLYFMRGAIELVRMILPGTVVVAGSLALMTLVSEVSDYLVEWWHLVAVFPFFSVLLGLLAVVVTVASKWLIVGRYRAGERPLWSTFVWRAELVTALHDYLATPMMLSPLRGTPFLSWYFRAMGARVGANVYFDSTFMTEFDLIDIGSNSCIDTECDLQTHLFEDRVMKMSFVRVGEGCTVGAFSVVLYDATLADGVNVAPLSLVLKGEALHGKNGRWIGSPVAVQSGRH